MTNHEEYAEAVAKIGEFIDYIFDHEDDFLNHFLNGHNIIDIADIHASDCNLKVVVVYYEGQHVVHHISNDAVKDWFEKEDKSE